MSYDLTTFDLGDMLKCSIRLREAASGASTLEASAQRVCRFLYDELHSPDGQRACALIRCYKTLAYASLEPDLQSFARSALGTEAPRPTMKCLTLMATVGESAAWNSRHFSRGHKAVPLPSPEIVEKAPMISQLIKELGLELGTVLQPSPDVVKELAGKKLECSTSKTRSEVRTYRRNRSSWFATESNLSWALEGCWPPVICLPSSCSQPCMSRPAPPTGSRRSRWM